MKIPKKVKIGGHKFDVLFPYTFKERIDLRGQCDLDSNQIRISEFDQGGTRRSDSSVIVTFIHELLHAIDFTSGHDVFSNEPGERAIDGISNGLYQVIIDNPGIFNEDESHDNV